MKKPVIFSLGSKFSVMLALFALLPSLTLGMVLIHSAQEQIFDSEIRGAVSSAEQTASSVAYLVQSAENAASILSQDQILQTAHNTLSNHASLEEAIDAYRAMDRTLRYFQVNNDFSIRVYLPDYTHITTQEWSVYGVSVLERDVPLPEAVGKGLINAGWTECYSLETGPIQGQTFTYCHTLFSYSQYSRQNSMICVDLPKEKFLRAFEDASQQDIRFFITDLSDKLLLSSDVEADQAALERIALQNVQSTSDFINVSGYGECCYLKSSLGTGGWTLHVLIPVSGFRQKASSILGYYVFFALLVLGGILLAARMTANGLVRELRALTLRCIQVKNGEYLPVPGSSTTKEIRVLQETFQDMVSRIDNLINDVYKERLAKQEARVEYLYEQMKPHFLYNTLESAKWMAIREGASDVAHFMETLSLFFRLTLSRGAEWVSLGQELELARTYIEIMNSRFNNGVTLVEKIQPGLPEESVMRLILQPFLENAVLHGIYEKESRAGMILLEAKTEGDKLLLTISDDGQGMDEETFDRLNGREKLGFGIANVRERLTLAYKEQFSVVFLPRCGGGTTVQITVPRRPYNLTN